MSEPNKTERQLAQELSEARARIAELETLLGESKQARVDQHLLRALLSEAKNVPDSLYFKDAESRFIRLSKSQADRFGLSDPAEAIGKTDFDFFTEEHARPAYEDEQAVMRSGQPVIKEEKETWPDGRVTWVSTVKMPLRDEREAIIGTFGISQDVTALKHAQAAVERHVLWLKTAAELSRAASSILDPNDLIQQVVDLVHTRFDLYYAGLFLEDKAGEPTRDQNDRGEPDRWAVLRAAVGAGSASEAGRQMLAQGYKLKVDGESLIGWCMVNKQPRIAPDVGDNPQLPQTRSELALPLISRGEVIGALTLQSAQEAAFSDEDVTVFQTMADQLANAIANARLYEQIRELNQQLEQKVQERTAELEQAYKLLERLDRSKSDFINIAAHELRTPLTVMKGSVAMMKTAMAIYENPYLIETVSSVLTGTNRLSEIVNSMLDVARIDSHVLDLRPEYVPIARLIEQVRHDLSAALEERQLTLQVEGLGNLPPLEADPDMLYKVFYNLVGNAIKFTPDFGRITISGQNVHSEYLGDCVEILVRDTGIGVDPDHHELIFEKFYQTGKLMLHSSSKTKFKGGGPGLGLAIARGIVHAHKGRIWVESERHDEEACPGSCFHVLLPARLPPTPEPPT